MILEEALGENLVNIGIVLKIKTKEATVREEVSKKQPSTHEQNLKAMSSRIRIKPKKT